MTATSDTSNDIILYEVENGVALLTLNRPERGNSWTPDVSTRYFTLLEQAARDPQVRAIVVTGSGRAFCVGGDGGKLQDFANSDAEPVVNDQPYWFALRVGKPVIAAVNGACFGIGMQQALCCDVRIAGEDAKFSTAYARRGVSAEFGMSWLLPRLVGMGHAMDMLLSARLVRSAEAERIGLVNRVVPDSELLSHAKAYAAEMAAQCSPQAMRLIKQQTLQDLGDNLPAAYARSEALLDQSFRSPDFREGVRSWQEQRPPSFPPLSGDQALIDLDS